MTPSLKVSIHTVSDPGGIFPRFTASFFGYPRDDFAFCHHQNIGQPHQDTFRGSIRSTLRLTA